MEDELKAGIDRLEQGNLSDLELDELKTTMYRLNLKDVSGLTTKERQTRKRALINFGRLLQAATTVNK